MTESNSIVPVERIERHILLVRGHKVLLDSDLANLYGVEVRPLNQAVKQNIERFPQDFMFQLGAEEKESLRSQLVILKTGRGGVPKIPALCFYGTGSRPAFQRLEQPACRSGQHRDHADFPDAPPDACVERGPARKLAAVERKYDTQFRAVSDAIRQLGGPVYTDIPLMTGIDSMPSGRRIPRDTYPS